VQLARILDTNAITQANRLASSTHPMVPKRMKVMRSAFFILFPVLFSLPLSHAETNKPNILFIAIDDLNDWLGCYGGHPQVKTPNIDQLAKQGVLFSNAHCQAPICNPSRVSMFLGKLPSTTGMYFLGPKFRTVEPTRNDRTLFQTFRENGYYLSTRGKVFHGKADPASFDHVENARGWRRDSTKKRYTLANTHPLWDWGQVDVPDEQHRDYQTAAWAAEQLPELTNLDKPFFLAVGFSLPHVPVYASRKWFDLYPLESLKLPETTSMDREDLPEISKQLTLNPTAPRHEWMVESGEWRHAVQAYLAANSFVDHLVGMMLRSLYQSDAADNTIVVLWSDHGFHLGEKLRWGKRTLWEETTRVPLIFSGPGIVAGQKCSQAVGLIDVFPTLLELAHIPMRADIEGQSMKPLLENPEASWNRPAICTFGPNNHSLRGNRYRYTCYSDGTEELYDHLNDPNELTNLLSDQTVTTATRQVADKMKKWLPDQNAEPVPGSAGSDSPLYGEGHISLGEAMKRGAAELKKKSGSSR